MITISLCMIVKNEEDALGRCLSSVRGIADEIVIVDTGSTDRTKEIAASFDARIFDFEWIDDFGAARNFAFSKATQPYIMWLDADDLIEEEDRGKLLELKRTLDPDVDSVTMPYNLAFDKDGNVTVSLRRNRIVKRSRGFRWEGPVHEVLVVSGRVHASEAAVTHRKEKVYTDRNLRIYRKRAETGESFNARDLFYFANEWKDNGHYREAIDYYERFLHTKQGWIEDCYAACLSMSDCYVRLGEPRKQLHSLLRSMVYSPVRAETCCRLGYYFFETKRLEQAIHWYRAATKLGRPESFGFMGMIDYASWTWLPHLQLAVCLDRTGDLQEANRHNELAASYNPDHPSILYNRTYFSNRLSPQGE
ncbi:glycosyltransferase [Paenibacillus koleovorans]|uniref:glycosyltransferase n=1 Tax=Paenibacillus koleovorans TaxID=121608 RepID=UPI000FDA7545|nr:glycosyltransferase [Paenibacillus koleovorans]